MIFDICKNLEKPKKKKKILNFHYTFAHLLLLRIEIMIETKLTKALGIEIPVIQGGMMWVGIAQLAAAVSNVSRAVFLLKRYLGEEGGERVFCLF